MKECFLVRGALPFRNVVESVYNELALKMWSGLVSMHAYNKFYKIVHA